MLKPRVIITLALTVEEGENVNFLRKQGFKHIDIFRTGLEKVNKDLAKKAAKAV